MSTVFKLKAALVMICALMVVNVADGWAALPVGNSNNIYITPNDNSKGVDGIKLASSNDVLTAINDDITLDPSGAEVLTLNGSLEGELCFNGNSTIDVRVEALNLTPGVKYYLEKDLTSKSTSTELTSTKAYYNTTITLGATFCLRIDDGTGTPGEIVATITASDIMKSNPLTASLVFSTNVSNNVYCGSGASPEPPVLTANYSPSDATVTSTGFVFDKTTTNYTLNNLSNGIYKYSLTVSKAGCSVTKDVTLTVAKYDNLVHDPITICDNNSVQLNATQAAGFSGQWSGAGVIDDPTNPTTKVTAPSGEYIWAATNGTCSFTEQWTITNNNSGLSDIASTEASNCGSVTLSVSHNMGVTPTWKVDGTTITSGITSTTTSSSIVVSTPGTHTIEVSAGPPSCKQTKKKTITVSTIDGSTEFGPETVTTCSNNEISIVAPTIAGATEQFWTLSGTTGTISNSTDNSVKISGLSEGVVSTLVWTVKKGSCSAIKTYTLQNGTVTASVGDNILLCAPNSSTNIVLSLNGGSTKVDWVSGKDYIQTDVNGQIQNPTNITVTVPSGSTTFTAEVTNTVKVNNITNFGCPSQQVSVTVYRVEATAQASVSSVCDITRDITLTGNNPNTSGVAATGYWSVSGGTVSDATSNNHIAVGHHSGSGSATFTWNIDASITGKSGARQSCTASNYAKVDFEGATVPDNDFCTNDGTASIRVGIDESAVQSGTFVFMGNTSATINQNNKKTTATVSGLPNGTTIARWIGKTNSGCDVDADITIVNLQPSQPSPSKEYVCDPTEIVTITAAAPMDGAEGKWTKIQGDAALTNETSNVANLTFARSSQSGVNKLSWVVTYTTPISNSTCSSQPLYVTVENLAVEANAGSDIEVCNYDLATNQPLTNPNTATLRAPMLPTTTPPTVGKWTTAVTGVSIEHDDSNVTDVTGLASGVNEFVWTVSRVSTVNNQHKCEQHDNVIIYNSRVDAADAGEDIYVCEDFTRLHASNTNDGTGSWELASGHGFFTESTPGDPEIGTHAIYEKTVTFTNEDQYAPYKLQKFVVRADVYDYTYNSTNDIVYTYYLLTGTERTVFTDGDFTPKMRTLAGNFTNDAANRIKIEKLYDDTYVKEPNVVRLQAGKNTFRWTVKKQMLAQGNGCYNYDDVDVYYVPVVVDAGGTQHLCSSGGDLNGSANVGYYANIPGITWTSEWSTTSSANIAEPDQLATSISNLQPAKNIFTLHAIVSHNGKPICDAQDQVIIWDNEVGDVYAGEDDVYCGDPIANAQGNGKFRDYDDDYRTLSASPSTSLRSGQSVSGVWTVIGGTTGITFGNSTNNVTSVTGLQRYMQDCSPDYWDKHTAENQFRWTVTYVNPETGEKCENSDIVKITWLAPFPAEAGTDQKVCGNDVDLNPTDNGCGAMMTWWDFSGSDANANTFNDQTKWSNPYWGGSAFLNENRTIALTDAEIATLVGTYGNLGDWKNKERVVFTDVVYLDGKNYRIQTTRDVYWNKVHSTTLHVAINYQVWECEPDGSVKGSQSSDYNSYKEYTGSATPVYEGPTLAGAPGAQLSLYKIANEVFNAAVYDMPSPADPKTPTDMTFTWYKYNELYSEKQKKVVSCLSWDEVNIQNLGLINDVKAGSEQAICNTQTQLDAYDAVAKGFTFSNGNGNNVNFTNIRQYWTTIQGFGSFEGNNSSKANATVKNLAFDTNIFRWTVEADYKEGNKVTLHCISSDDVYVTNAQPTSASVGEDREVCDDHTVLSANLPVRGVGEWVVTNGDATAGMICSDQQCDAYVTNMSLGPNTFLWKVTNEYYSPKNPETVYAKCHVEDEITLYNHKVTANAGPDQYICSDRVELTGNSPDNVASPGAFAVGSTTVVPTGKWSQVTSSVQGFYLPAHITNNAPDGQLSIDQAHVFVKPLARTMHTFFWTLKWGGCESTDEVKVYNNLPDPDPQVMDGFNTCENMVQLNAQTALNSHDSWMEWTSSESAVTFDGLVNKTSSSMSPMVYNLRSGVDNIFTLTYYRINGNPNPDLAGMPPVQLGEYQKKVEEYDKAMEAYAQYGKDLDNYNALLTTYTAQLDAYNQYLEDMSAFEAYSESYRQWLNNPNRTDANKPVAVPLPDPVSHPTKPIEPTLVVKPKCAGADTSACNTSAPWSGKGLWNYYADLGEEFYERFPNDMEHAQICRSSANTSVHSNAINITAFDLAECDYMAFVNDGVSTPTSNNVFVTCVNKMDTINEYPYGRKTHKLNTPNIGFSPAVLESPAAAASFGFTGAYANMDAERSRLRVNLANVAVSGTGANKQVDHSKYSLLWTQLDGPKTLKIDDATILTPTLSEAIDGSYTFEVYGIRMNTADSYCESKSQVKVDIHIPTMAAIEAKFQGIGDWTLDRTAMCQDNIDMQWMSATGITYTPSSKLNSKSKLQPGFIYAVDGNGDYQYDANGDTLRADQGKEYSIFRIANNDVGGGTPGINFTEKGFVAGTPGMRSYHVSELPYNGTNFELLNCIDFRDPTGNIHTCITSDTITIFNNSVYADADVHVDPDKSKSDYHWERQEVNLCVDEYNLEANDPTGFDGNLSIELYATHGMWGFDDKDFKGFAMGRPKPRIDNTTAYSTRVSGLWPSDNHQRANGMIWCVYKSILPPECNLTAPKASEWAGGSSKWYPMRFLCSKNKTYRDFYNSDGHGHIYFYYTKTDADGRKVPDTDGDKFFQVAYTDPDTKETFYTFIKTTYTGVECATDGSTLQVFYIEDENTISNESICINQKTLEAPENGQSLMPYDKLRFQAFNGNEVECFAMDAKHSDRGNSNSCLAFYSMEDIDNADPDISQRMKVSNFLFYMRNSCTSVNDGRMRWNYYVTINDNDPDNIYVWSDRQTTGLTYGNGTTYECSDGYRGRLNSSVESANINNKGGLTVNGNFNHFFKGALALIPTEDDKTWLKNNFTLNNATHTGGNRPVSCWPTQFDGGGDDAPPVGWRGGGFRDGSEFDPTNANPDVYAEWRSCVIDNDHNKGTGCGNVAASSCGLCGFAGNINFFTWSLWGYGQPGAIPVEILKHKPNGDFGHFFDSPPPTISGPANPTFDNNYTNFATKKGSHIANNGSYDLNNDIFVLPGWDRAYHVVNFIFDNDVFESYMDKLIQDISRAEEKAREPIKAKAQTVDELKEEADNADKHYWCVARDTVFLYDNRITSMSIMPNFVVCDDKAELIGEEPGAAAGSNASGYWTVKTNTQAVSFDNGKASTDYVTNVKGLPAGETQFNWHITRWGCEYDGDMFVFRNNVSSDAGRDVYTCDDYAQLEAVQPSTGVGRWELTQASAPNTVFGDAVNTPDANKRPTSNNSKAWSFNLQQGDNPLKWIVENPMPPYITETGIGPDGHEYPMTVLDRINGHVYSEQESCPVEDEMIVHDLRPDAAVIQTGEEIPGP